MAAVRHRLDSTRQLWLPLSNAIAPRPPGLERENPQTALLAIGVEELHRRFLRRNLQLLRDCHQPAVVADLLAWIREPPRRLCRPFSFQACLRCEDPRLDPDTMQALVLAEQRRRIRLASRGRAA